MSGQTVSGQIEQSMGDLLNLDEAELVQQLGRLLVTTEQQIGSAPSLTAAQAQGPSADAALLASPTDVLERVANRFLKRFNRQLYNLICDPNDPDNPLIRTTLESGTQSLGLVLGGALVATFGWLPGIAAVIAAIIVKRIIKAGHTAVCEVWREQLEESEADK
jgi:hypothetical protein